MKMRNWGYPIGGEEISLNRKPVPAKVRARFDIRDATAPANAISYYSIMCLLPFPMQSLALTVE